MKNQKNPFLKKIIASFFHAEAWVGTIALLFLLLFAVLEVMLHLPVSTLPRTVILRIVLLVLISFLFYLAAMLYAVRTGDKRLFPRLIAFFFVLYLYLLLDVTLFEKGFGRDTLISSGEQAREYYLQNFVNFIPFHSIWKVYVMGLANGFVSYYYALLNLLGNICVFMPMSFFLLALFKAQRKWYVFLPTITSLVICVELLQFYFMVGSCDIDDVILNVLGAAILYFILRLPPVAAFVYRASGTNA